MECTKLRHATHNSLMQWRLRLLLVDPTFAIIELEGETISLIRSRLFCFQGAHLKVLRVTCTRLCLVKACNARVVIASTGM